MDLKTAYEHYWQGKATPEEIELVRKDMAGQGGEHAPEQGDAPEQPEVSVDEATDAEPDTTDEQEAAGQPATDDEQPASGDKKDLPPAPKDKQVGRLLRHGKRWIIGFALVLAVVLVVSVLPQVVAFNPNSGYVYRNAFDYQYSSQFFVDMAVLTELFQADTVVEHAEAWPLGRGQYDIALVQRKLESGTISVTRDKLGYSLFSGHTPSPALSAVLTPDDAMVYTVLDATANDDATLSINGYLNTNEEYTELMRANQLGALRIMSQEDAWARAHLYFKEPVEIEKLAGMMRDYPALDMEYCFVETGQQLVRFGYRTQYFDLPYEVQDDKYPQLMLGQKDSGNAAAQRQHFLSMLEYLRDRERMRHSFLIEEKHNRDTALYTDALTYVEEHGVMVQGVRISGQAEHLLEFIAAEDVDRVEIRPEHALGIEKRRGLPSVLYALGL